MKPVTVLLLAASLIANAILFFRWRAPLSLPAPPIASAAVPAPATSPGLPVAISPQTWEKLQPHDLPALVAELRARGFPPLAIRTIVNEQLRERFADRYQAISDAIDASPYWHSPAFSYVDPKVQIAQRALLRDVAETLRELLGPAAIDLDRLRRSYGQHSPTTLQALDRIHADYRDLIDNVRTNSRGLMLAEDRAQIAALEQERRRDVDRLLGPDGVELYDLHSSSTASGLRSQLSAFEPTEAEFRAVFRVKHAFALRHVPTDNMAPEERRQLAEAEKQLEPEIAALLGPDRYAEYRVKTDREWLFVNRYVERQGLPPGTTNQLVTVQRDITQRAAAIRSDAALTAEQRDAQLAALEKEAAARLLPALGSRGLETYRQQPPGTWLPRLRAEPRSPPKP